MVVLAIDMLTNQLVLFDRDKVLNVILSDCNSYSSLRTPCVVVRGCQL